MIDNYTNLPKDINKRRSYIRNKNILRRRIIIEKENNINNYKKRIKSP